MSSNQIHRVIIVHGWADDPTKGWMGWLAKQLQQKGIEVLAPLMPDPKKPKVAAWMVVLSQAVGKLDERTVIVGHSLGAYVALQYLDQYQPESSEKLGKLILVAGFAGHERVEQGKQSLPEVNFEVLKSRIENTYSIYSDNDEVIPPAWSRRLGELLDAENIIDVDKGHFAGLHGCNELPTVLEAILA